MFEMLEILHFYNSLSNSSGSSNCINFNNTCLDAVSLHNQYSGRGYEFVDALTL